jgi:hypothetical protein
MCTTFERRRSHSIKRVEQFTHRLAALPELTAYPGLAIYTAGSHAREEASEHSDVDLFFIHDDRKADARVDGPRMKTMAIMSGVAHEMSVMRLPPPSNDGEYLKILSLEEILKHLGSPEDDHLNHFTARMLLLLESAPVYGKRAYNAAMGAVVDAYLRDYKDHAKDFRPIFLANDILRYWKTVCLNYEHKRNQRKEALKIKQKIRNFKLGYSRLLTCFATIAVLSSFNHTKKRDIVEVCHMTPIERLLTLFEKHPAVGGPLLDALRQYHWFLEKTELPTEELERYFGERDNRITAFGNAKAFGDHIYQVVRVSAEATGTFRYLVV